MSSTSELPEVGDAAKRCQSQVEETSKAALDGAEGSVSLARWRSEVGNAAKRYKSKPDDDRRRALEDARRDLASATLEAHIRRVVDSAPLLSQAQKDRLAVLLRGAGVGT